MRNLTRAVHRFSRLVCLCREAYGSRSVGVPLLRDPVEGQLGFSILPFCEGFVHICWAAHLEATNPSGQSRGQTSVDQQRCDGYDLHFCASSSCELQPHVPGMVSLSCSGELEVLTHGSIKNAALGRSWKQEHRH